MIAFALIACGGAEEGASGPIPLCVAGDPPVALASWAPGSDFNGMVTDGARLYLAQGNGVLWSIDTRGGNRIDIYGQDVGGTVASATPVPMLLADGGIFFDTWEYPNGRFVWVSATGGPPRVIASSPIAMFDWSRPRAFEVTGAGFGPVRFDSVALSDGSSQTFATTTADDDLAAVAMTRLFLHVILVSVVPPAPPKYSDRRIDLSTGQLHDEVALHIGNSQVFMGPNAICAMGTDALGITCLGDDQPQDKNIPVATSAWPRYVDADWVYAAVWRESSPALARFSLMDGQQQLLRAGAHPQSVTSFGDCVYAATIEPMAGSNKVSSAIWRISPPKQ